MKDSLDILRTDYVDNDSIAHHGVKGMKWGVRKKTYVVGNGKGAFRRKRIESKETSSNGVVTGRKKTYTTSNGKGAFRRERLEAYQSGGVVGGGNSYGSISETAIKNPNMSEKELVELHNKTVDDIRKTATYSEIFKLAEELKKIQDDRKANLGQGNLATEMVIEAKSEKIINQINEKLKEIDDTFAKETSKIKYFKKDFSPSKWVVSDLSEHKSVSAALGLNRSTGRVDKGWSSSDRGSVSKKAKGYTFVKKQSK